MIAQCPKFTFDIGIFPNLVESVAYYMYEGLDGEGPEFGIQ